MRARLAMFSPLSPVQSAIADYTEGLLPGLARHFDITAVTTGDYTPTHPIFQPDAQPRIPCIGYDEFQRRADEFDLILYQLGDEAKIHGYMFDAIPRYPGVVVLHDLVLHHAIVGLTLARGDVDGYIAEMCYAYGEQGRLLAQEVIAGNGDAIFSRYPLVERTLDNCLGVIVHNNYVRDRVRGLRPELPVQRIVQPFFLPTGFPPDFDGAAFRRQLGLDGRPVVASFGFFVPDKRLGLTLRAFKRLLRRHPAAIYLLVGGHSPYYDLNAELSAMGLGGRVRLTGWQTSVPFVRHMFAADVAVHLRYPHIGGTPYTPIRLLGLGVPTIVSDIEPLAELPADAVVRIKPDDPDEEAMLFSAMDYLLIRRDVAQAMAANGRRYVAADHDLAAVTQQFVEFLRPFAGAKAERRPGAAPRIAAPQPNTPQLAQTLTRIAGAAAADMGVRDPSPRLLNPIAQAIQRLTAPPSRS